MPQPVIAFLQQSQALKAAIADCLKKTSPKPVHRLRSSTRRIEATLELLAAVSTSVPVDHEAEPLRKALRKLRRVAGAVRDLDVHRELLKTCKKSADTVLLDRNLSNARESAARKLADVLEENQKKVHQSLNALEAVLKPVLDLDLSGKELIHLTRSWFAKSACNLDPEQDDQLHSIRKAGKTARYIAETGAGASKAVATLAARFEHAQETLGAWHDYLVLLDEAQASLSKQSPTTEQILQRATGLHLKAKAVAKRLLVTFCAVPTQAGVH
ncbi:MAG: CHAD domain-containing protein [Edaphobacter sp.]